MITFVLYHFVMTIVSQLVTVTDKSKFLIWLGEKKWLIFRVITEEWAVWTGLKVYSPVVLETEL